MRRIIMLLLLSVGLSGCNSPGPSHDPTTRASDIEFGWDGCPETVELAAKAGVNYKKIVNGCMSRDPRSLHIFFWLSTNAGFDAASSQGHAAVTGSLLRYLGDKTFGNALKNEPIATQRRVQDDVKYNFGDDDGNRVGPWLTKLYPITFGG